jgi:hypothetical protein
MATHSFADLSEMRKERDQMLPQHGLLPAAWKSHHMFAATPTSPVAECSAVPAVWMLPTDPITAAHFCRVLSEIQFKMYQNQPKPTVKINRFWQYAKESLHPSVVALFASPDRLHLEAFRSVIIIHLHLTLAANKMCDHFTTRRRFRWGVLSSTLDSLANIDWELKDKQQMLVNFCPAERWTSIKELPWNHFTTMTVLDRKLQLEQEKRRLRNLNDEEILIGYPTFASVIQKFDDEIGAVTSSTEILYRPIDDVFGQRTLERPTGGMYHFQVNQVQNHPLYHPEPHQPEIQNSEMTMPTANHSSSASSAK